MLQRFIVHTYIFIDLLMLYSRVNTLDGIDLDSEIDFFSMNFFFFLSFTDRVRNFRSMNEIVFWGEEIFVFIFTNFWIFFFFVMMQL